MKVTFLLTFYNQEEFVDASIRSILAVDKPEEWELLIGDDGSTDGTIAKVQEYVDQYPEHIRLFTRNLEDKKNVFYRKYVSMNRLRMLDEATGDYFCLLDGDDWYIDTSFVKEAMEILQENADISVVMYGYRCFLNGSYVGENLTLPEAGKIKGEDYLRKGWYVPAGACVHRNCYDAARRRLLTKHAFFDDNQIVYNSLDYGDIYSVQRAIYGYQLHDDSTWHSLSPIQMAVEGAMSIDVCRAVLSEKLGGCIEKRGEQAVLQMYAFRDEIKTLGTEKREQFKELWQSHLPSPRYDLFRYEELSPAEFREVKRQLIRGKEWKVAGQHLKRWKEGTSTSVKAKIIPKLNRLPYIRRLVAENEGLRRRLEELSQQLAELQEQTELK